MARPQELKGVTFCPLLLSNVAEGTLQSVRDLDE
jgi:hypothetical protein